MSLVFLTLPPLELRTLTALKAMQRPKPHVQRGLDLPITARWFVQEALPWTAYVFPSKASVRSSGQSTIRFRKGACFGYNRFQAPQSINQESPRNPAALYRR